MKTRQELITYCLTYQNVYEDYPFSDTNWTCMRHVSYTHLPNPESVHFALMAMKLSRQDCYFIGDSDVDIETGYRADMKTIGVSWGFRGRLELEEAGADYVVDEAMEIWRIINENWGE